MCHDTITAHRGTSWYGLSVPVMPPCRNAGPWRSVEVGAITFETAQARNHDTPAAPCGADGTDTGTGGQGRAETGTCPCEIVGVVPPWHGTPVTESSKSGSPYRRPRHTPQRAEPAGDVCPEYRDVCPSPDFLNKVMQIVYCHPSY